MNIYDATGEFSFDAVTLPLWIAIAIVGALLAICLVVSLVFSIILPIKYLKYNRQETERGVPGCDVARNLLDYHNLQRIDVKKANIFTAFMIGNSYSHWFKRVRLRGLIYKKASLTSVAIAGQKVGLARLDAEGDKDMKKRIWLLPILSFAGPWTLIICCGVGILLDFLFFEFAGWLSLGFTVFGAIFYLFTAFYRFLQLRTEKKAQDLAIEMLSRQGYLTEAEVKDARALYQIYNLNYIIDIVISILQTILRILKIILQIYTKAKSSSSSN